MTAPNHIVGGYTFTGIFASILGINILSDWSFLVLIGFASLLPDIDHTKSLIGKIFYPFSIRINRRFGHRTITHSLIFIFITTSILAAFQSAFFPTFPATILYFLALFSHVLFDMMTVQGVPLFYPFMKNACVLPGNPSMRLRTSNLRHEAIAMCTFLIAAMFLQPLIENGFWTQYNRAFGTIDHLKSEYNKSNDLLHIEFDIQEGSNTEKRSGEVIRTTSKGFVLLRNKRFEIHPRDGQRVTNIYMVHTGKVFEFRDTIFYSISPDDFNGFAADHLITNLNIYGTENFMINKSGKITERKEFEDQFVNNITISKRDKLQSQVAFKSDKSIQKLENQIIVIKQNYNNELATYRRKLKDYEAIKLEIQNESNIINKEILIEETKTYKEPEMPEFPNDKLRDLELKLQQAKHSNQIRYDQYLVSEIPSDLRLSVVIEYLTIKEKLLSSNLD